VFPDKSFTKKPAETRMGKGKGAPEGWVAVIKPGKLLYEMEGVPIETAKESIHLIKGRWGEGITGLVSIGAWTVIAWIPIGVLFGVGVGINHKDPNLGAALIAIAVGVALLVSALSLATREVFSVALYRYANGATGTGAFATADLEDPFSRRGGDDRGDA